MSVHRASSCVCRVSVCLDVWKDRCQNDACSLSADVASVMMYNDKTDKRDSYLLQCKQATDVVKDKKMMKERGRERAWQWHRERETARPAGKLPQTRQCVPTRSCSRDFAVALQWTVEHCRLWQLQQLQAVVGTENDVPKRLQFIHTTITSCLAQPANCTDIYTPCLKNNTVVAQYNFNSHQPILVIFGKNVPVRKRVQHRMFVVIPPLLN